MTTIAYHHSSGVIAVDGMISAASLIACRDFQKWRVVGDEVWFLCGAVADFDRFIDYHTQKLSGAPDFSVSCSALIASGGKCFEAGLTQEGEPWRSIASYNVAQGSGVHFAIAAMDHGKTAVDAVKYAAMRDASTGGKISALDIKTGHWVTLNE